jgi:uncharacterized protein (TIGR03067 family)
MARTLAGTVLALVAIGVAGADNPRDRDEGKVLLSSPSPEGVWLATTFLLNGRKIEMAINAGKPANVGKPVINFVFAGNHLSMRKAGGEEQKGAYAACIVKGVGEIDLTSATGVQKGILRFDGEDNFTLCLGAAGKERPKEFESKPGQGRLLVTLKRIEP